MPASRRRTQRGPRPLMLSMIGWALYLPILGGFVLHTSPGSPSRPVLGKYSLGYALFLVVLVVAGGLIPLAARAMCRPTRIRRPDGREQVLAGWRKVRITCLAVVLAVVLGAVAAEAALRIGATAGSDAVKPAQENWEVFYEAWPPRRPPFNAHGWLGPEIEVGKPPGTFRIVALGGSTTILSNFVEPRDTFTERLARSLKAARPRRRIEVVNAACQSHTSAHSLNKYATLIRDFHPDLVLVMHGVNDWQEGAQCNRWDRRQMFQRDDNHNRWMLVQLAAESGLGRPAGPVWRRTALGNRLAPVLGRTFFSDRDRLFGPTDEEGRALAREAVGRALPAFRRNLLTLGRLVQADGARFVILSQPTMYRPGAPADAQFAFHTPEDAASPIWGGRPALFRWACTTAMRRYNDAAERTAEALSATFVDLEQAVPPQWAFFTADEHDGVHMNAAGCERAAQALQEAVPPLVPDGPARSRHPS